jgi:hypothetical protein
MPVKDNRPLADGIPKARSTSLRIQALESLHDRRNGIANTTAVAQRRNLIHYLTGKEIKWLPDPARMKKSSFSTALTDQYAGI